jgi:hypothetical protein
MIASLILIGIAALMSGVNRVRADRAQQVMRAENVTAPTRPEPESAE